MKPWGNWASQGASTRGEDELSILTDRSSPVSLFHVCLEHSRNGQLRVLAWLGHGYCFPPDWQMLFVESGWISLEKSLKRTGGGKYFSQDPCWAGNSLCEVIYLNRNKHALGFQESIFSFIKLFSGLLRNLCLIFPNIFSVVHLAFLCV